MMNNATQTENNRQEPEERKVEYKVVRTEYGTKPLDGDGGPDVAAEITRHASGKMSVATFAPNNGRMTGKVYLRVEDVREIWKLTNGDCENFYGE